MKTSGKIAALRSVDNRPKKPKKKRKKRTSLAGKYDARVRVHVQDQYLIYPKEKGKPWWGDHLGNYGHELVNKWNSERTKFLRHSEGPIVHVFSIEDVRDPVEKQGIFSINDESLTKGEREELINRIKEQLPKKYDIDFNSDREHFFIDTRPVDAIMSAEHVGVKVADFLKRKGVKKVVVEGAQHLLLPKGVDLKMYQRVWQFLSRKPLYYERRCVQALCKSMKNNGIESHTSTMLTGPAPRRAVHEWVHVVFKPKKVK